MGLFDMSSEQKLIKTEVRKFTSAVLEPVASDIEKEGRVPSEIIKKLAQMGLFGLTISEEYGGSGLDALSLCVALQELSKSCASVAMVVAVNNCLVAYPLAKYGSDELKKDYLKLLPDGGTGGYVPCSDLEVAGKECSLDFEADSRHVSGKLDIVLNGASADFFVIPVKSGNGTTQYIVNRDTPGLNLFPVQTMGMRAAGVAGLEFQRSELKEDQCLIGQDDGLAAIQSVRDYACIAFSAIALGLAEAALEASVKYSKERKQFGRPICAFPMVQNMLAEMKIRMEKSRLLVYEAASTFDSGEDYAMKARVAFLTSGEGSVFAGLDAIQIHGGYGYTKDYPVERYFRDAKTLQALGGVSADIKSKIAEEILQ